MRHIAVCMCVYTYTYEKYPNHSTNFQNVKDISSHPRKKGLHSVSTWLCTPDRERLALWRWLKPKTELKDKICFGLGTVTAISWNGLGFAGSLPTAVQPCPELLPASLCLLAICLSCTHGWAAVQGILRLSIQWEIKVSSSSSLEET